MGTRLLCGRRERAVAGLPDVPVRLGATAHGRGGARRRFTALRAGMAVLFDVFEQGSAGQFIAIPEILWEAFLGIYQRSRFQAGSHHRRRCLHVPVNAVALRGE